jgi:PD-(D/E)XK nuclease superfamily
MGSYAALEDASMPEQFLSLVAAMLPAFQEIEKRLDRETGRRFNTFSNIFLPNEVTTSRILAFLLDPHEAHGQNEVFLRAFVRHFVPEWEGTFNYSEAHQESMGEPIDVLITDGRYWLGIENKIFGAQEQPRQAGRYLDALCAATRQAHYRLVYLSPRGKAPTKYSFSDEDRRKHGDKLVCGAWVSASDDKDRTTTPYGSILEWLVECRNQCCAENVAWLLKQFSTYAVSVVAGPKEADMVDAAIVGLALNDKDGKNLEAALRIGESLDEIRRAVISTFLRSIEDGLNDWAQKNSEGWEVISIWSGGSWIKQPGDKYKPIVLRKNSWPQTVGVSILAEYNGPRGVHLGIVGPTQASWKAGGREEANTQLYGHQETFIGPESRERIANAMSAHPGPPCSPSDWWAYYENFLADANRQNISDWRDLRTLTRLFSERDELSRFTTNRITFLATVIGALVIDET